LLLFTVTLFPIRKSRQTLPAKKPDRADTYLVKHDKGHGHQALIDHVRGGSEDGCDDKGKQDSVFPVPVQKGDRDNTHLAKKHHDDGQFEDDPEGYEQPEAEGKILLHRWHRAQEIIGIAQKELECRRKNHEVAKGGAAEKKEGGKETERQEYPFFMLIEPGGHKTPELIKNHRTCQKNPTGKGKFQIKKNPS